MQGPYWQSAYPGELFTSTPACLAIEQDIHDSSLLALLFAKNKPIREINKHSPIVENTLKICCQLRKVFKLPQTCTFTPIGHAIMHFLLPDNKAFLSRKGKGIVTTGDL